MISRTVNKSQYQLFEFKKREKRLQQLYQQRSTLSERISVQRKRLQSLTTDRRDRDGEYSDIRSNKYMRESRRYRNLYGKYESIQTLIRRIQTI